MAYSERTRLYEVLVRYHPDGTVAAHQRDIQEVLNGTDVVAATEGPAVSLVVADVAAVVGSVLPALSAERDALTEQVTALTAERDALVEQLSAAQQTISELQA